MTQKDFPRPPQLGEKIVQVLLDQADSEAVLGDFAEEYDRLARRYGPGRARRWYWLEFLKSSPAFIFLFKNKMTRSRFMKKLSVWPDGYKLAVIGLILSLPALLLVSGGVLQSAFGLPQVNEALHLNGLVFHPALIMGGLTAGFALNVIAVTRVDIQLQEGALVSTVKIKGNLLSLGFIALAIGLAGIIFLYLLAENFQIFQAIGGLRSW